MVGKVLSISTNMAHTRTHTKKKKMKNENMKHTHVRTSVIANVSVPASQTPPTNIPFGDHREVLFFFV